MGEGQGLLKGFQLFPSSLPQVLLFPFLQNGERDPLCLKAIGNITEMILKDWHEFLFGKALKN